MSWKSTKKNKWNEMQKTEEPDLYSEKDENYIK